MPETNKNFNIPVYCDYYKQLLVEELVYSENPAYLHYGKCSVIGKIAFEDGRYLLQNIKLSSLDEVYRLPTGAINILVVPPKRGDDFIPVGQFVEVIGEIILWDHRISYDLPKWHENNSLPETPCSLIMQIRAKQIQLEKEKGLPARNPSGMNDRSMHSAVRMALKKELHDVKERYEPAIQLHSFKVIDQADELITCNLELRAVQIKKRHLMEARKRSVGKSQG